MRPGSSCLPWESARCSTSIRANSGFTSTDPKEYSLGVQTSSRLHCPLLSAARRWSSWSASTTENVLDTPAASSTSDYSSGFTSGACGAPAPEIKACSQLEQRHEPAPLTTSQDSFKNLPTRPKLPQIPHDNQVLQNPVHENRSGHRLISKTIPQNVRPPLNDQSGPVVEVHAVRSRCRPRRRPCTDVLQPNPPKLRRDTDCTEAIVRLIVFFSTKLVHSIWSQAATTPKSSKDFNGAGVLPLQVFIQETLRRSKTSYSTLQVALFYLILLKPHIKSCQASQQEYTPGCRALQCGRRMFLTALILASKYLQDRNYSARAWSKISGLPVAEINENERRYLELIKYNLHMTKESFENWSKVVLSVCKASGQGPASNKPDSPPSSPDGLSYSADIERPGSSAWWSHHLMRLTPEVVKDSKLTEEYLTALASTSALGSTSLSLDTPPSSPESLEDMISESGVPLVAVPAPVTAPPSAVAPTSVFPQSPAFVGSIPSRPLPQNLPTPQSTPRYNPAAMFSRRSSQSDLRCRASLQALVGVEKQALNAANLSTCPPPRPRQACNALSNYSHPLRTSTDSSDVSWLSSPESLISDISSSTTRSRSSSMSSNSSIWSMPMTCMRAAEGQNTSLPRTNRQGPAQDMQKDCAANIGAYSFYHHVRPQDAVPVEANPNSKISSEPSAEQPSASCNSARTSVSEDDDLNETQIAQLLASLGSQRDHSIEQQLSGNAPMRAAVRNNIGPSKKHKRSRPSKEENVLHDEIRHFIWGQQVSVQVEDDKKPTTHVETWDKQAQYPSQLWALPKKPVPNAFHNKRVALQHSSSPEQRNAPELAAEFLRRDVTVV